MSSRKSYQLRILRSQSGVTEGTILRPEFQVLHGLKNTLVIRPIQHSLSGGAIYNRFLAKARPDADFR